MKRVFKTLAICLALFISVVSLASCSNNSFKYDWKNDLTFTDGNDQYVTKISLEEAKQKKNNKESFVLITASNTDSSAVTAMQTLFDTMVELGYTSKDRLYYVDSTEASNKGSVIANFIESLGVKGVKDVNGAQFVVQGFSNGFEEFDTSDSTLRANNKFNPNGNPESFNAVDYYALAQYILVDFAI